MSDKTTETKFPLSTLRAKCMKLFKVTSSTFAGATANLKDGDYTVSEVKKTIDTWLKKEVK